MLKRDYKNSQSGFTLVEIIVSTAIFIMVVSAMLSLFNYTLRINRRVQALREVTQTSRVLTETLTKEIRNGRIDYSSWTTECAASNYTSSTNQSLSILTKAGDKLCFYVETASGNFFLKKQAPTATTTSRLFESTNFTIIPSTFRIYVRPTINPNPSSPPYPEQQPFVTIVAQFQLTGQDNTPTITNYQTSISTDVYDILDN
jgi:type II secretory pathway pseudopilin PulG